MARDLWLTRREVGVVDKLKQSLTIGANTFQCGPINGSYSLIKTTVPLQTIVKPITLSATAFTVDFWGYTTPPGESAGVRLFLKVYRISGSPYGVRMSVDTTRFYVEVTTTTATYTIDFGSKHYQWTRYTVAIDTAANKADIYFNGELQGTLNVAAGNFSAATNFAVYSSDDPFNSDNIGYLQDLALFNVYKNNNAVKVLGKHKGASGYYSNGLTNYWKLRINKVDSIDANNFDGLDSFSTTQYAPIKFGASFVVAQYEVTLTDKVSFQFPVVKPAGTTGILVVRWTDDDGVVQRRRFWELDGVEIYPIPEIYNGEPVSESFVLEWWNIDGETYLTVPEDFKLYVSKTTSPTTTTDTNDVAITTLTVRTLLAQNYSLTFPLTFPSQQTFSS